MKSYSCGLRIATAVALSAVLFGCEDDECVPVEDLAGAWHGTYTLSTGGSSNANRIIPIGVSAGSGGVNPDDPDAGPVNAIELVVSDDGNGIAGAYMTGSGAQGTIDGRQNGALILFEASQSGACSGTFDGTAEVCGNRMTIDMTGEDCEGESHVTGNLRRVEVNTGTCRWTTDGECDEPQGTNACAPGSDTVDCAGVVGVCLRKRNGICDESVGTGLCPEGTDVTDCRDATAQCAWHDDGVCDEPEGTGLCVEGADSGDCGVGPAFCAFTNDGVCDEPENGGSCAEGTDFNDCNFVGNFCPFTDDGFCDEVNVGGSCPRGSDFNDCNGFTSCPFTDNGQCDEPEGTGACVEGTDFNDCNSSVTAFCADGTACSPGFGFANVGASACCLLSGGCGVTLGSGSCVVPEPIVRSTCPPLSGVAIMTGGGGCCLESGVCGIDLTFGGLGCVSGEAFPDFVETIGCDPNPLPEDDAGAP